MKKFFLIVLFALGCTAAIVLLMNHPGAPDTRIVAIQTPSAPASSSETSMERALPEPIPAVPNSAPPRAPTTIVSNAPAAPTKTTRPPRELQDPLARAALGLVGVDPDAEQYWAEAIFDPSLSEQEREDLMEDLNEEGLSDPRHPTPEDMRVIANRIPLIEEAALVAARGGDTFALSHLGEAYKDLWNLLYGFEPQ